MDTTEMCGVSEEDRDEGRRGLETEEGGMMEKRSRDLRKRKEEAADTAIARKELKRDERAVEDQAPRVTVLKKAMLCDFFERLLMEMRDVHRSQRDKMEKLRREVGTRREEQLELATLVLRKRRKDKIARMRRQLVAKMAEEMEGQLKARSERMEKLRSDIEELQNMMNDMRQRAEMLSKLTNRITETRVNVKSLVSILSRSQELVLPTCLEGLENARKARIASSNNL